MLSNYDECFFFLDHFFRRIWNVFKLCAIYNVKIDTQKIGSEKNWKKN